MTELVVAAFCIGFVLGAFCMALWKNRPDGDVGKR